MDAPDTRSLPPNAYTPLAAGEGYRPVVPSEATMPEATLRSIGWGLFLCVVFTVASAYSGLSATFVSCAASFFDGITVTAAHFESRENWTA